MIPAAIDGDAILPGKALLGLGAATTNGVSHSYGSRRCIVYRHLQIVEQEHI